MVHVWAVMAEAETGTVEVEMAEAVTAVVQVVSFFLLLLFSQTANCVRFGFHKLEAPARLMGLHTAYSLLSIQQACNAHVV